MLDEVKYLKKKAIEWCDIVRTCRITPTEAWYCLNRTIMKTVEYPLMATCFSRKQVIDIMAPILQTILSKCKIQRKIPHKMLYGTLRSCGFGVKDPYLFQLVQHLQAILRHTNRATPSGELLVENMELVQVHMGLEQPFWDLPSPQYGHLAMEGWMKFTWKALCGSPLSLKGPALDVPPARVHDCHLMDVFVNSGYEREDLETFNSCRLYLRAHRLSDICTADRTSIHAKCWEGLFPEHRNQTPWMNAHKPSQDD